MCALKSIDEEAIVLISADWCSEHEENLGPRGLLGLQGLHGLLRDHPDTGMRRSNDRENDAATDCSQRKESQTTAYDESICRARYHRMRISLWCPTAPSSANMMTRWYRRSFAFPGPTFRLP